MLDPAWCELWRTDDLLEARAVSTTNLAMEYEARLIDRDGNDLEALSEENAPYRVQVRESDWPELSEVVEEIVAEQAEFDTYMQGWRSFVHRLHRAFLLVLIAIVILLAIFGAIAL